MKLKCTVMLMLWWWFLWTELTFIITDPSETEVSSTAGSLFRGTTRLYMQFINTETVNLQCFVNCSMFYIFDFIPSFTDGVWLYLSCSDCDYCWVCIVCFSYCYFSSDHLCKKSWWVFQLHTTCNNIYKKFWIYFLIFKIMIPSMFFFFFFFFFYKQQVRCIFISIVWSIIICLQCCHFLVFGI